MKRTKIQYKGKAHNWCEQIYDRHPGLHLWDTLSKPEAHVLIFSRIIFNNLQTPSRGGERGGGGGAMGVGGAQPRGRLNIFLVKNGCFRKVFWVLGGSYCSRGFNLKFVYLPSDNQKKPRRIYKCVISRQINWANQPRDSRKNADYYLNFAFWKAKSNFAFWKAKFKFSANVTTIGCHNCREKLKSFGYSIIPGVRRIMETLWLQITSAVWLYSQRNFAYTFSNL